MSQSSQDGARGESLNLDEIWQRFLTNISTLVSDQALETWFRPLSLAEVTNDSATIECPSQFLMDWVMEHHTDKIIYSLRDILGTEPRVQFVNTKKSPDDVARERAAATVTEEFAVAPKKTNRPSINNGDKLNPKYTFEEFVVGSNSRMTFAACMAVSERPAMVYNPLFIYGGVGLGKTHLMQAVGHVLLNKHEGMHLHYSSAESFMNEMITAIRNGMSHEFRSKYRNVDALLIDDIQFLAGKESTQEEFFHTFNALHGANKQIIVTSDRPPKEIPTLEERLVSRFEWGLITDIQSPDYETRLAILRKKVDKEQLDIPDEVLSLIADNVTSNIRELEGSLVKLTVHAGVYKEPVTLEVAQKVLQDFIKTAPKKVQISTIQKVVAQHYNIPVDAMKSKSRTARLAFPRQVAIYLARELTASSLTAIGKLFGGRDHTTVIHACNKIGDQVDNDVALRATVNQLRKDLL